ncbi:hypothetical protein FOCC_FOCC011222 [Frankliniella occidentalis]|nr:hypothetical protein FOCC_FOCC011222 [Frankliniella occidentalis]
MNMGRPGKCCVTNCSSTRHSKPSIGKRFFQIPKVVRNFGEVYLRRTLKRQKLWLIRINRNDLKYGDFVCSDHFVSGAPSAYHEEDSVDWAPSLNMGSAIDLPQDNNFENSTLTAEDFDSFQLQEISMRECVNTLPGLKHSSKGAVDCKAKQTVTQGTASRAVSLDEYCDSLQLNCHEKNVQDAACIRADSIDRNDIETFKECFEKNPTVQCLKCVHTHEKILEHEILKMEHCDLKIKHDSLQNEYDSACHSIYKLQNDLKSSEAEKQVLQNEYDNACHSIFKLQNDLKNSEADKRVLQMKLEAATEVVNNNSQEINLITEIVRVKTEEILKLKEEFETKIREEYENEMLLQVTALAHNYENNAAKLLSEIDCLRRMQQISPRDFYPASITYKGSSK